MSYRATTRLFIAVVLLAAGIAGCSQEAEPEAAAKKPASPEFVMIASDSGNALDLLLAEHDVIYTESSIGAFVKEIDSLAGGADNGYWMYKVNDTMVPVASDKMILQPGDTLTWFLAKPGE